MKQISQRLRQLSDIRRVRLDRARSSLDQALREHRQAEERLQQLQQQRRAAWLDFLRREDTCFSRGSAGHSLTFAELHSIRDQRQLAEQDDRKLAACIDAAEQIRADTSMAELKARAAWVQLQRRYQALQEVTAKEQDRLRLLNSAAEEEGDL